MKHIFKQGIDETKPTLLLLHGTGGNEEDLLPIADMIDSTASVLSVRGNVSENGMPRFFKRLAEGVFDMEDLIFRTKELYEFIKKAAKEYNFDENNVVAVGYSNGANIAASMLFHYDDAVSSAILLHPMVPMRDKTLPDLTNTFVFIAAGTNDPICAPKEAEDLSAMLQSANAKVHLQWENYGHSISQSEVKAIMKWYKETFG